MAEPVVRLMDVAENFVYGYLFRVVTHMSERDMAPLESAHWKVVMTHPLVEPESEIVFAEPTFRVLMRVSESGGGINELVHLAAAETVGPFMVLPSVELASSVDETQLESLGWRPAHLKGNAFPEATRTPEPQPA